MIYQRFLDDIEVYLNYKRDLDKKIKDHETLSPGLALPFSDYQDVFWKELEQLEILREISRRALDEYIATSPIDETVT